MGKYLEETYTEIQKNNRSGGVNGTIRLKYVTFCMARVAAVRHVLPGLTLRFPGVHSQMYPFTTQSTSGMVNVTTRAPDGYSHHHQRLKL